MPPDAVVRLAVPSADVLARIGSEPLPLGLRAGVSARVFYRDVYFDTEERTLEQRGVICRLRIPSAGLRSLAVRIRELPASDPVAGSSFTSVVAEPFHDDPFAEATDATRLLRAIVDPDRLRPQIELETDRAVRQGRHRWLLRPLHEFRYDRVTARVGDRIGALYEASIRRVAPGGPAVADIVKALGATYDVHPVLGDKVARARALFYAEEVRALESTVRGKREVAVIPFDFGRLGLHVDDGVLTVLAGPGGGEDACRDVLKVWFGSGQGQLRLLGTSKPISDRPAMEVWLARRIPSARAPGSPLEWLLLDDAVSLVGSPAVRDARTLAALHVAARSDLMHERPVWAVHAPVPGSMSLYLSDEMPTPDLRAASIVDPALPATALDADRPSPEQFINRDLSQLAFNARVLELAEDRRIPVLERMRFLSIFGSNTDEAFMVRVGALKHVLTRGKTSRSIDGLTPRERLDAMAIRVRYLLERASQGLWNALLPELAPDGIKIVYWNELSAEARTDAERHFHRSIYPVLTPLAASPGHPFPHIPSLTIAVAAMVRHPTTGIEHFAAVPVPKSLPRFSMVQDGLHFLPIESIIAANLNALLPGLEVQEAHWFRVTRSAEVPVDEWNSLDLLQAIEEKVERRPFGPVVRLEVQQTMPQPMRELLLQEFRFEESSHVSTLSESDVYEVERLPDLSALAQIADLELPELHYSPFSGASHLTDYRPLFDVLRERDLLFHFPYDAFESSIERFFVEAVEDPNVLVIKVALYRTDTTSRIVDALMRAARKGKQVVVLIEIKARFEEERNIEWVKELEATGVHVLYGLLGLKTHAKVGLVVRQEEELRRYAFVGTGNLNADTAHLYTDLSLLTSDPDIGADVHDLFNALSGNLPTREYRRLLVAPPNMLSVFLRLIEREIEHAREGRGGRIRAKMNGLADPRIIGALYRASQAGVEIDLVVRGICSLRPGVRGLSDHIRVVSILGRFLEHARVFHFGNGGADEYYLGSADWRPRNMRRRVEVVVPVTDSGCRARIDAVLEAQIRDASAWELGADGSYARRILEGASAQDVLMAQVTR